MPSNRHPRLPGGSTFGYRIRARTDRQSLYSRPDSNRVAVPIAQKFVSVYQLTLCLRYYNFCSKIIVVQHSSHHCELAPKKHCEGLRVRAYMELARQAAYEVTWVEFRVRQALS
jgi:hypothetical protein